MTLFEYPLEGKCLYCHHIRELRSTVLVQHTYLGSAICPGSGKSPMDEEGAVE